MAKKIISMTVGLVYDGDTDSWSVGSSEMISQDPTASPGSSEGNAVPDRFNNMPTPNFAAPMNAFFTAILASAKGQQNIP